MSTLGFIVFVIIYLAIVQLVPYISTVGLDDFEYGTFPDVETVVWALVVPVGASLVFVIAVATWLGWWPQMLRDHRPVNKWVWFVPIVMVIAILAGTDYGSVFDTSVGFVVLFLLGTAMVGIAEETVFRGVGVTAFRANGYSEPRVALWTSVIFGLAHGTNVFVEGPSAFVQVLSTAIAGFFFYLVLRVTGSLIAGMALHALWDAGLFTGLITDDTYFGGLTFMLANVVLAVVLLIRRHHIEPWENGGPTNPDNLVLLCRTHHGHAHSTTWQLTRTPHGLWWTGPNGTRRPAEHHPT